jgi:hypothetical protein
MAATVASGALFLVVILNVVATVMLARSDFESRFQKVAQMILIWAIPFVGSILVLAVSIGASADRRPRSDITSSDGGYLPGIGPNGEGRSGHYGSHGEHGGYDGHGGDGGHGGY